MDPNATLAREAEWEAAFSRVRERNVPEVVKIAGHAYKLYPSGRALCAASYPFHSFTGTECDCAERVSGGTIKEWTL